MRAFLFAMGLIAGFFGALAAHNLGLVRLRKSSTPARPAAASAEPAAESADERPTASVEAIKADLARDLKDPQGKNLDPLAVLLEEAIFERSWPKVQAAAESVRGHGAEWVAPPVGPPPTVEERSVFDVAQESRRRFHEHNLTSGATRASEIARRRDPRSIDLWLEIFHGRATPVAERIQAAELLVRSGDERAIADLGRALRDGSGDERLAAGRAFAAGGLATGLRDLAQVAKNGTDPEARANAVSALGFSEAVIAGQARESRAVIEALADTDARVRAAAVEALGNGDLARIPTYVDAIAATLERDASPAVRLAAAKELAAEAYATEAVAAVLRNVERALLRADESDAVAKELLRFLQLYGDSQSLRALDDFGATPLGRSLSAEVDAARDDIRYRTRGR